MARQHINIGQEADKTNWPKDVRPITIGQIDMIGVDHDGHLYWDGKKIEIARRLDLSWGERIFALVVGGFTILGCIGGIAQGWAAAHQWSCQAGYIEVGCPKTSPVPGTPA